MGSAELTLATGPISWGVDFADGAENPPWEDVLDEIARSQVTAIELGPIGYLPEEAGRLRAALADRGLQAAGSFIFDDLHDPARRDEVLAAARRAATVIAAAGGEVMVIIDRPSAPRVGCVGRGEVAPRLGEGHWAAMIAVITEIAAIAAAAGLRPAFHPHAGSWVEFPDETDRVLEEVEVGLCLDLGHAAIAGIDAASALGRWGDRLVHLHLKDVDPEVLGRVRAEGLDFWAAIDAEIFCPLGDGMVDLAATSRELARLAYGGFATIEQDRRPGGGDPLEDLRRSVEALAAAGFTVPVDIQR